MSIRSKDAEAVRISEMPSATDRLALLKLPWVGAKHVKNKQYRRAAAVFGKVVGECLSRPIAKSSQLPIARGIAREKTSIKLFPSRVNAVPDRSAFHLFSNILLSDANILENYPSVFLCMALFNLGLALHLIGVSSDRTVSDRFLSKAQDAYKKAISTLNGEPGHPAPLLKLALFNNMGHVSSLRGDHDLARMHVEQMLPLLNFFELPVEHENPIDRALL
jgi:hypothetical protein